MEKIKFNGMDNLLNPIEKAKKIGLIKPPKQIENEQKTELILYGMSIMAVLGITAYLLLRENKKEDKN